MLQFIKELPFNRFSFIQIFYGTLVTSILLGSIVGFILARSGSTSSNIVSSTLQTETPKSAQSDTQTFRDFAEGVIQKRPAPKNANEYIEGTHILTRETAAPVALTSSVVDLSEFEGQKVKVYGETQKAIKEGWLMDVGKVETQ